MRTEQDVLEEIKKVETSKKQAQRKVIRCDERLAELNEEISQIKTGIRESANPTDADEK